MSSTNIEIVEIIDLSIPTTIIMVIKTIKTVMMTTTFVTTTIITVMITTGIIHTTPMLIVVRK